MPQQSTDATEAVNRSFEPDDEPRSADNSSECSEWVNDCLNAWFND